MTLILASCTQTDQSKFRLVCRAWRNLTPAHALKPRVAIYYRPGWEQTALQVRQRLPNAVVVVRISGTTGLDGLLRSPFCSIVSCFPQSFGAFEQWQRKPLLQGLHNNINKQATLFAQLKEVADIYEQAPPGNRQRLELHLRLRSEHIVTPAISAELLRIKPAITEIREHTQMMKTATLLFPMDSLKVCALTLPRKPLSPSGLQHAMKLARNLEFLQIYVHTENTARIAVKFIDVLPDLPRVASLRLISSGCATCLPVTCLQHVTHLELGRGVYCDALPSGLRSLVLQTLSTCDPGYPQMLAKLSLAVVPISIAVREFESTDLARLDANMQQFRVQAPMSRIDNMEHSCTCRLGLARLTQLRVLCVSDFLTATLVELLEPLCFPELHTFGFGVDENDYPYFEAADRYMVTPSHNVVKLGVTFPALQHLDIVCRSTENDMLVIQAEGITSAFPGLCGVTCYSPLAGLELQGLSSQVQVAAKCCLMR